MRTDDTFWKVAGRELLVAALKEIPVAGKAAEVFEGIQNRYEYINVKKEVTNNSLEIQKIQNVLESVTDNIKLGHKNIHNFQMATQQLQDIKKKGYFPAIFDSVIAADSHRREFLNNPAHYGRVLEPGDTLNPEAVQLVAKLDGPRIIEISPFVMSSLFGISSNRNSSTLVSRPSDVWSFAHTDTDVDIVRSRDFSTTDSGIGASLEKYLPRKLRKKERILAKIAKGFTKRQMYREYEVDKVIKRQMSSMGLSIQLDPRFETTHVRRNLIESGFMERIKNGTWYWRL